MTRSRVVLLVAVALLTAGCTTAVAPSPARTPDPVPSATASSAPVTPAATTPSRPPATRPPASRPPRTTVPTPPPPTGCSLPPALLGQDVARIPTTQKVIALTFDGGGDDSGTASILATLADRAQPATFFLTGAYAERFPASARRIAASHPVGNHTQNHPTLTRMSDARVVEEVRAGAASIERATGVDPRPYFRFPFGDRDARTIGLVNDECYVPFRWTVDTLGWKGTSGGMSVQRVTQRVLDGATNGGIILMHLGANPDDGTTLDADALPGIIQGLRDRGYTLVTLERVLPATP